MRTRFASMLVLVTCLVTSGCLDRKLRPLIPCTVAGVVQNVPVSRIDKVDLLFVIDNSQSMAQEQTKLRAQLPRLVDILIDGDDLANPGVLTPFPPVNDLKVGVVTTDMGLGGVVPSPVCGQFGDNGTLQNSGSECSTSDSAAISYQFNNMSGTPADRITFDDDVACVTDQGTAGCGFEQQLDATVTAFTNGGNLGFVRSDALLAVILVTDEEDCTTPNAEVFDLSDTNSGLKGPYVTVGGVEQEGAGNLQRELRCWKFEDELRDIDVIVEQLRSVKADNPENFVFAAIAGVPNAPVVPSDPEENATLDLTDYDAVLADARMQNRPNDEDNSSHPFFDDAEDNTASEKLVPVCQNADGRAFPARRIVETAKGLQEAGVSTVVGSICDADYTGVLNNVIERIGDALRNICLPNELNRNADGKVGCEVTEVQPVGGKCADEADRGRTLLREEEANDGTMREVCTIEQQPSDTAPTAPTGAGWFYDDFTVAADICTYDTKQRVSFTTEESAPETGTRIRFECLQTVVPNNVNVGTGCSTSDTNVCREELEPGVFETQMEHETRLEEQYDRKSLSLFCESASNTCQLECNADADCPGGFTCFNEDIEGNAVAEPYCANPTCTLN